MFTFCWPAAGPYRLGIVNLAALRTTVTAADFHIPANPRWCFLNSFGCDLFPARRAGARLGHGH